jgi:predicted esterase
MGPYGAYDMFGNVREWLLNSGARGGLVIGGNWQDAAYSFGDLVDADRFERTPLNGFRLMKSLDAAQDESRLRAAIEPATNVRTDFRNAQAVSDERYRDFLQQFAYTSGPPNASAPVMMAETEYWTKQKVTIDAGYNAERLDVILFIPKSASPPFQPVVFFSGLQIVLFPDSVDRIEPGFQGYPLDYVVKSGRVLVQPVFQGTFERFKAPVNFSDQVRTTREWMERRWDLGRTMDYLETRSDIDAKHAGFIGTSFGASYALPLVATEPRLKAAVLLSGGYGTAPVLPVVDAVNFVPRIRIPVLMVNGRFDQTVDVATRQRPMFEQLGTPDKDKRYVLLNFGHGSAPRAEVLRETLGWLDKYLGPVNQ